MKPVVLDTDVVSFLFKSDTRATNIPSRTARPQWFISFMTEAELEQWALLANWSEKRVDWLRLFLSHFVVVPSSHDLVLKWAEAMLVLGETAGVSKLPTLGSPRRLCSTMFHC